MSTYRHGFILALFLFCMAVNSPAARSPQDRMAVFLELEEEPAVRTYLRAKESSAPGLNAVAVEARATVSARTQMGRIVAAQDRLRRALTQTGVSVSELYGMQHTASGLAVLVAPDDVPLLRMLPGVRQVRPIRPMQPNPVATPDASIGATAAWQWASTNLTGAGVRLGIIDTGLDYLHADFGGPGSGYEQNDGTRIDDLPGLFPNAKVAGGYDFCGDDYDGYTIPRPDPDPMDCDGHGTSVAGVAGGLGVTTNGTPFHGSYNTNTPLQFLRIPPGVAPGATLYGLRVFGCSGSTFLVPQALDWAVDPDGDGVYTDRLDVVNISIGSYFSPPDDLSFLAIENASLAGVMVVQSAGNDYDTFFISGCRGERSVVTAAALHDTYFALALRLRSPSSITGLYEAAGAEFGPPPSASILTNVVYADPPLAGTPLINAAAVNNNICLVDRGSYDFVVKVKNAQNAGARAVIVANNRAGSPATMGGSDPSITIPSLMISQTDGGLIKSNLAGGVKAEVSGDAAMFLTSRADTIVDYSSQGPALNGILKPDISAPTEVMAPKTGTGSEGGNFNGTSCASPVAAGAMALLKQRFPTATLEELKALMLNSASHDLYALTNGVPPRWQPSRAGAGRLDLTNALNASLIAYSTNFPGTVHGSFDLLAAGSVTQMERQVRIVNRSGAVQTLRLGYESLADVPGAAYSFPWGTNVVLAAYASTTLPVRLTAAPNQLRNAHAPAVAETQPTSDGALPRHWLSEESGYMTIQPAAGATLRLALHAVVRPASVLSCTSTQITLGAVTGTVNLALTGQGVRTGSSFPSNWVSLTSAFALHWRSTNQAVYGSVRGCGIMTDWPALQTVGGSFSNAWIAFGVALTQPLPSLNACRLEAHVDLNGDGLADRILRSDSYSLVSDDPSDVFGTWVKDLGTDESVFQADLHGVAATGLPTAVFHSGAYFLLARAGDLGLSATNTRFQYHMETVVDGFSRDRTPRRAYDAFNPGLAYPSMPGRFLFDAQPCTNILIRYDRSACQRDGVEGVLLLHHLNAPGQQAEFIPLLQTNLVSGPLYVSRTGSHAWPFASWLTAATNPCDAARAANDGAVIYMTNGMYNLTGPVELNKGVILQSMQGALVTTLNGRGLNRCLELNHSNARVVQVSISNGAAAYGGGVFIQAAGGRMEDCRIVNNAASQSGGGVYMDRAGVLERCALEANMAADRGGAVYLKAGGSLKSCLLARNQAAGDGGGAFCSEGGELLSCTGRLNQTQNHGGAVMLDYGGTVLGGHFQVNTGQWGGAISCYYGGYIANAAFVSNYASAAGGALNLDHGGVVSNCVMRGNKAWDGGGAVCYFGGTLIDCSIEGNAASYGGGVLCWGASDHGYVQGCTIRSNGCANNGGGIRLYWGGIVRDSVIAYNRANYGGGVNAEGSSGLVERCVVYGNFATNNGGGIDLNGKSRVVDCAISNNTAPYGGGFMLSGEALVNRCRIMKNIGSSYGGGAYVNSGARMYNSLVSGNSSFRGGGFFCWYGGDFINCTMVSNNATGDGGGAWNDNGGRYTNCIVYFNTAPKSPNYTNTVAAAVAFTRTCSFPLPAGSGNLTNTPMLSFAATNYARLQTGSPCIDQAVVLDWMAGENDAAGLKRIVGAAPDIGAFEYPFTGSGVPADWLMTHSLFTDGSSDYADDDGDGLNNYAEWRSGTDPRNGASCLRLTRSSSVPGSGLVLQWASVDGKRYRVARTTNLMAGAFPVLLYTNLLGVAPLNTVTDAAVSGSGPWLYRIGVE
ncbi:MAG TPA: hypothetical protein DCZ95_13695 [Verrucomicrobia bacterium]|nr:MAG: hypothetical protein A2X46_02175 [Lentisphaerae bacterium GWF2_57_35]HBA85138.1 hypothetical protein [Verrucomicrobiota bacterium]